MPEIRSTSKGEANLTTDPTALTTDALRRENANLKELIQVQLGSVREQSTNGLEIISTRIAGMDKAIELVRDHTVLYPEQIREAIQHLKHWLEERIARMTDVTNEKVRSLSDVTTQQFKSIEDKFAEKDKAVSVGLSAQKESAAAQQQANSDATNKMETNFTTLIKQLADLFNEMRRNTEQQLNDQKNAITSLQERRDPMIDAALSRIVALENRREGVRENMGDVDMQRHHASQNLGILVAGVFGALGFMVGVAGIVIAILSHH